MRHQVLAAGLALYFCWIADVSAAGPRTSRGQALRLETPSTVVLGDLPEARPEELARPPAPRRPRNNFTDDQWNRRGEFARGRRGSPNPAGKGLEPIGAPALRDTESGLLTPPATTSFRGLSEKLANAFAPSDMGLAVGTSFVLQVVNGRIGVYDKKGVLQSGFPKSLNSFFLGEPTVDPRALYDWVNNRFIVIAAVPVLVQNVAFIGLAVSTTSDPRGAWRIGFLPSGAAAGGGLCPDFPTLGQDRQGIYIGDNLFPCGDGSFGGRSFVEAEVMLVPKGPLYAGQPVMFFEQDGDFLSQGEELDSIQPANVMNIADRPRAEFMVASYNINYGGGQCLNGCTGLAVFAVSNPFGFLTGGPLPEFSEVDLATGTQYFLSLGAHQPGSNFSIDADDTRITGGVVYSAGSLFASVNTGCVPECSPASGLEETQPVWWEIGVTLSDNDDVNCTGAFQNACPEIESAFLRQEQCFGCGGRPDNGSAYYATLQPDDANNVTMVFNYSDSSSIFPGTFYTSRRVTQAQNTMHDDGLVLMAGATLYNPGNEGRWGDYTGTAVDFTNRKKTTLWFSGMFVKLSTQGVPGLWGTQIGTGNFSSVTVP